jgi:hypothetical protein
MRKKYGFSEKSLYAEKHFPTYSKDMELRYSFMGQLQICAP